MRRAARDPNGPFEVICTDPEAQQAATKVEAELPAAAFHDPSWPAADSDRRIIAEALAGGADTVLTNNMHSINHVVLNDWCRDETGHNRPFILNADAEFQRLAARRGLTGEAVVKAALAMSVADRASSDDEEWQGVQRLLSFATAQLGYAGYIGLAALRSASSDWRGTTLADARRPLKDQARWAHCRTLESERVGIVRSPLPSTEASPSAMERH